MPRKGREFEKLVAHLESILAGTEIKVKSPDRVVDIHTGKKREIDVTLRTKVGSHDILVILECREHKTKQHVTWIEQLATKRASVGAAKAVAVSATKFSEEAIQKATMLNIELRSIDKLSINDINQWCRATHITVLDRHYHLQHLHIVEFRETNNSDVLSQEQFSLDTELFREVDGNQLSVRSFLNNIINKNVHIYDNIIPGEAPIVLPIQIKLADPLHLIHTGNLINAINIIVELWIETSLVPASDIVQYSNSQGGTINQVINFTVNINGQDLKLTASHIPEEGTRFFAKIEPKEAK